MADYYRGEEMCLAQLFLQNDSAYACIAELGELGIVQFNDLNPDTSAFQRRFVNEVRRCDEMERKLRYLEKEIVKDAIPMLESGENPDAPQAREMVDLEATFERLENELREVNTNEEMLKKNYLELTELKHILRKTQAFFDEGVAADLSAVAAADLTAGESVHPGMTFTTADSQGQFDAAPGALSFVTGVIARERVPGFERLLWRACRGNVFLRHADITEQLEDPNTGDQLKTRVKKICEGYRATMYPCPETAQERRDTAIGVMTRIEDLKTVLGQTQDHRHRVLVAAAKNVRMWFTKVRKIKAIYHTLNLFNMDVTSKALVAECWAPTNDLDKIQMALQRATEESGSTVPNILNRIETKAMPPTYHRTNKITKGFQNIVDAYGHANYREINPTPFTVITFPFLFAVMFGDLGHGFIMFLGALFLVLRERDLQARRIRDEIFQTFFGGRYVILLMGAFAIYTGFIYNDLFSRSLNLFDFSWTFPELTADQKKPDASGFIQLDPAKHFTGSVYPIGIDPIWNLAENKLAFLNSFKMKMSVILGIGHMLFGVMLSLQNYRYFNKTLDVLHVFVPQLLFLTLLFVYLCILIIAKWINFGVEAGRGSVGIYPSSHCAPSLLIGFINMFMMKGRNTGFVNITKMTENFGITVEEAEKICLDPHYNVSAHSPKHCIEYPNCNLSSFYWGQGFVEGLFLLVGVACVPWMLLGKPLVLRKQRKQYLAANPQTVQANMNGEQAAVVANSSQGHDESPATFDFGETMVYSGIHTIEFALGCISHTASYLRLWALSLAHAQLSEVLWSMVLRMAFSVGGESGNMDPKAAIAIYIIVFVFSVLTIAILVFMEGLSAFLHALRLHWVEFQSKFYSGTGHAFVPFSFDDILSAARDADHMLEQH